MSDLLSDARDLRQKLYRLEMLLQVEKGRRSRGWFRDRSAPNPEQADALKRLERAGLIETVPPPKHFRLTSEGREFLKDVRARVGAQRELDWSRADEIDFSKL